MRALMFRKRFSKQVRQEEVEAFENAGLSVANLSRGIILMAIFITLMVIFRRKLLIWFSLAIMNVMMISYYCYIKRQSVNIMEQQGFQYNNHDDSVPRAPDDDDRSVASKQVRKIYVA